MMQKHLFLQPPDWIKNAIAYQVFPDRFKKSTKVNEQKDLILKPWGSNPHEQGFHGGDLYGLIDSIDYFKKLGINCIYLNPIFTSASNHRYHTYDYFQVDPLLGGNQALDDLIQALHKEGIRIVLDGVFNHCSRGFWAFHNLLENGKVSPYIDWFNIHKWPLNPYPKEYEDCGYSCWWGNPALPKFNHNNPSVRKYLISAAAHWVHKGIDGWRLDVADEVEHSFWKEFRKELKSINPDIWIIGEIWGEARSWLKGDEFDGVMNYRIGWSTLCWAGGKEINKSYKNPEYPLKAISSKKYLKILKTTYDWYPKETNRAHLNLLDSHDVPRSLNSLKEDSASLKLALFLLFIQSGVPCIYYGTEAGLAGGKEPGCRESFPWDQDWKLNLIDYIQSLIKLRQTLPEILEYTINWVPENENIIYGVLSNQKKSIFILVNRSQQEQIEIKYNFSKVLFLVGELNKESNFIGAKSAAILYR